MFFNQNFNETIVMLFDPLGLLLQVLAVVRVVDHLNNKIKRRLCLNFHKLKYVLLYIYISIIFKYKICII